MTYALLLATACGQTPAVHPAHHGGIPGVAYTSADLEAQAALALSVSTLTLPPAHAAPVARMPPVLPVAPTAVYSQPWGYAFPVVPAPVWRPVSAWGGGGWFRGGPIRCTPRG